MSANNLYLIWSNQHRKWWGPGRFGYVNRVAQAGRYSEAEALDICSDAMPDRRDGEPLPEIPVPLELVTFMVQRFAGTYPHADPEPPESTDVEAAKALKGGYIPMIDVGDHEAGNEPQ